MEQSSDLQLLESYLSHKDERSFEVLVSRHVNMVYGTALRCVKSPHIAEEISQIVFLELAKNPPSLPNKNSICAWLHQVTRNKSVDFVRRETSRKKREQMTDGLEPNADSHDPWALIEPTLDDALGTLPVKDRTSIILRFFESKNYGEIGRLLGSSEEAARKRVHRSLKKLWVHFNQSGLQLPHNEFESILTSRSALIAPAGLIATISCLVKSTSIPALASTTITQFSMTIMQKSLAAVALTIGIGTGIYETNKATHWKEKFTELESTHHMLGDKAKSLENELHKERAAIASLLQDNNRLKGDLKDLHRLRSEVTQQKSSNKALKSKLQDLISSHDSSNDLIVRIDALRNEINNNPDDWIPEMELLNEDDWIQAARKPIRNDVELRWAMSELRRFAEKRVADALGKGISAYQESNEKKFPKTMKALLPYVDESFDRNLFERWDIFPIEKYKLVGKILNEADYFIGQKTPVDGVFDFLHALGPNGSTVVNFQAVAMFQHLKPVYDSYAAKNDGQFAENPEDYFPFVTNDQQRTILKNQLIKNSVEWSD